VLFRSVEVTEQPEAPRHTNLRIEMHVVAGSGQSKRVQRAGSVTRPAQSFRKGSIAAGAGLPRLDQASRALVG